MRIQAAFLSQVLAHKYPLSLEQADLGNSFLDHTSEEADFFILLVSRDRAGSASLKGHFTKQIEQIRKRRMEVVQRLGRKSDITEETKGIYYSSWAYAAVHVALTVPHLRKVSALEEYLGLGRDLILKILTFLTEHYLAEKKGDEFFSNQNWIRLDRSSHFITMLHSNWRQKAIENQVERREDDLHFSGVYSLDLKTASCIRESLLESISNQVKKIEVAPEKELFAMNVDFFNLKNTKRFFHQ